MFKRNHVCKKCTIYINKNIHAQQIYCFSVLIGNYLSCANLQVLTFREVKSPVLQILYSIMSHFHKRQFIFKTLISFYDLH